MPGKIVKTNQVLMLVGDGYFVERSCFEANECLKRRVNGKHIFNLLFIQHFQS